MKKIEQSFQKIIFTEMVFSVVYAIIGLIIFLKSEMTNTTVGLIIGTFFFIAGCIAIFSFIDKNKIKLFRFNIVFGILSILLSIFIMFNPLAIIDILNISLGIWLVVGGIHKIVYFMFLKKVGEESNKIFFVSSLLFIFLGILIILNPFRSMIITKTVGIFIILYNILNLNDLVLLKRRGNKFLKLFK